jgi:hypothetical protein
MEREMQSRGEEPSDCRIGYFNLLFRMISRLIDRLNFCFINLVLPLGWWWSVRCEVVASNQVMNVSSFRTTRPSRPRQAVYDPPPSSPLCPLFTPPPPPFSASAAPTYQSFRFRFFSDLSHEQCFGSTPDIQYFLAFGILSQPKKFKTDKRRQYNSCWRNWHISQRKGWFVIISSSVIDRFAPTFLNNFYDFVAVQV